MPPTREIHCTAARPVESVGLCPLPAESCPSPRGVKSGIMIQELRIALESGPPQLGHLTRMRSEAITPQAFRSLSRHLPACSAEGHFCATQRIFTVTWDFSRRGPTSRPGAIQPAMPSFGHLPQLGLELGGEVADHAIMISAVAIQEPSWPP